MQGRDSIFGESFSVNNLLTGLSVVARLKQLDDIA